MAASRPPEDKGKRSKGSAGRFVNALCSGNSPPKDVGEGPWLLPSAFCL